MSSHDSLKQTIYEAMRTGSFERGDQAFNQVRSVAESAAGRGHYFTAGYMWMKAADTLWGRPDDMVQAVQEATGFYQRVLDETDPCSQLGLAARIKLAKRYLHAVFERSHPAVWAAYRAALSELAESLMRCFADSLQCENWLVRGALINVSLSDQATEVQFQDYEVDGSLERTAFDVVTIGVQSAFQLMRYVRDYTGAIQVAELCPGGFTTPVLLGWREAVLGYLDRDDPAEHFAAAAAHFGQDTLERAHERGQPSWSGINTQVWAPYFQARAAIARLHSKPGDASGLLAEAARALPIEDIHYSVPDVRRLAVLVRAIDRLISPESGVSVADVRQQLAQDVRWDQTNDDEFIDDFLNLAGGAFEGFRTDPATEIGSGRLASAIEILNKITVFRLEEASAIAPAIQKSAVRLIQGLDDSWIVRNLHAIHNEDVLRRILLRLLQAELPLYAQIVHGPIEYGRDVVALTRESDGQLLLSMYQVKAGDVTTPVFNEVRRQLEDMFLVPVSEFQFGAIESEPRRVGILVCNGHVAPIVEPVVKGWFIQERKDHGREYRLIHLDSWVRWIVQKNLLSTFRHSLMELGVYQH